MKTIPFASVFLIAAGVLLGGCSTPQTRIAHDPTAYAQLSPDQQNLVRTGRISVGMSRDAVRLALGQPDRITLRVRRDHRFEVWHYIEYIYAPGPIYWGGGGWGRHGGWGGGFWIEPDVIVGSYDRHQVEFTDGRVSAFTEDRRSNWE
jgi:hypothetical protein